MLRMNMRRLELTVKTSHFRLFFSVSSVQLLSDRLSLSISSNNFRSGPVLGSGLNKLSIILVLRN